jgi:ribosomal protein L22
MSAEEDQDVAGETPAEPSAEKPAAAKREAAKKPAAEKKAAVEKTPAAQEEPAAEEEPAAGGEPIAEKKPAVEKKPAAKKAAAKKASPEEAPVAAAGTSSEAEGKAARTKAAPAKPSRRRVVRAHARYVRTSARKARMVSGHLPGKTVPQARAILEFTPREVARDWSKLLESAVANAENNHELLEDDLVVREAYADEGPTIKRFRPRAMGRATPIHKRTSHLTITLTPGS